MLDEIHVATSSLLKLAKGRAVLVSTERHNSLVVDNLDTLILYRAPNNMILYANATTYVDRH